VGRPWRSENGARPTALVVQEEGALRDTTRLMLERNGFDVVVAGDGQAAIALSRHHQGDIDLLLTDAFMPAMQGIELAETIKAQRPRIVVVYMSSYVNDAFGNGARPVALIERPFDEAQLLEVLDLHMPD
jgi:two-component system cell cycle sensor histidine kinase/response regulator CckA